jgi:iron complex transport system ATP-binding protein
MIRVEDLSVSVSDRVLISGVRFEVETGTVLGVYGPNGAGKSTLLRALSGAPGLDRSGRVLIDGSEISSALDPAERARKILRMGSDFHSPFGVRVEELFDLAARSGGKSELISEVVDRLGLARVMRAEFGLLSDGEKQWAMFGRALVQDPGVLILDETFSKLDLDRLALAGKLIRQRVATGKVVLVTSHELNRLASWSDRLLFLDAGKLIAEGPVGEVFTTGNLRKMYPDSGLEVDSAGNPPRVRDQ